MLAASDFSPNSDIKESTHARSPIPPEPPVPPAPHPSPLNMSSANPNPNNPNHFLTSINHPNPSHPSSASASARPSSSCSSSSQAAASACAACKYQRRKCNPDCTLAPYFRPDQQRQFLNAHRLFGVSNILKIIRNLDQRGRDDAMKSIIFESNARAADPVGGCYRIICDLERQIGLYSAELMLLARHLEMFRAQAEASSSAAAAAALPHHYNGGGNSSAACLHPQDFAQNPNVDVLASAMEDYAAGDDDGAIYGGQYTNLAAQQQQQQQYYNYFYFDGAGIDGNENNNGDDHELNSFSVNLNDDGSNSGLEIEMLSLPHSKDDDDGGEDDEAKPFVDIFDTRQLVFPASDENEQEVVSKETSVASFHCRTKSSEQNETNNIKHGQEHDLKTAASLFTLTNCNTSIV